MSWGGYGEKGSGGSVSAFVEEGNVKLLVFSDQHVKVRFLTEDVTVEDVMVERGVSREEAEDILYTQLSQDRWIMPRSVWEHTIKEVPGKRFFSSVMCTGRGSCPLCAENEAAKANGISENKLLPYPARKRFVAPAYVYDLDTILYVRGAEKFFDGIAEYIEKYGSDCDFEIWKVGRGLATEYKSIFVGKSDVVPNGGYPPVLLGPRDVNLYCGDAERDRRIAGGRSSGTQERPPAQASVQRPAPAAPARTPAQASPASKPAEAQAAPQAVPEAPQSPGDFVVPFGSHKGMTLGLLAKQGEVDFIRVLANNGAGIVRDRAAEYLKELGL